MKRSAHIWIVCSLMGLFSCQKEIDWGFVQEPDLLLMKIFSKTGADSATVLYTYNVAGQLIRENTTGVSGSNILDNDLNIYRNASGIIKRTVQVSANLRTAGIDSIVTRYYYDSASSRYTSSAFSVTLSGTTVTDSSVYTYDTGGMITTDEHYLSSGIIPPVLSLRNQYSYTADGLTLTGIQQSVASTPGGPLTTRTTQLFSNDNKKSPLVLKQEAVLLVRPNFFSTRNPLSVTFKDLTDPTADYTLDIAYIYLNSNKPDSSFATRNPGNIRTVSKYFYQ